jgi:antitoxin component of RelBE/YafQ-DinJ toxin-antitoxin module
MPKVNKTYCFDAKIIEKAETYAKELGMSVSAFLTMLINNYK